jgi:hypothetical protein
MLPLRVGLNRVLAAFLLGVSALNFYVFVATSNKMQLGLSALFCLIGLLYMFGNVLVITAGEVQIKNPLGMTLKAYPIGSLAELELREKKLYLGDKKIASLGFVAAATDVHRLGDAIAKAKSGSL